MKTEWNGKIYSTIAKKGRNRKRNKNQMRQIENKQKNVRHKPNHVNNYTEFK